MPKYIPLPDGQRPALDDTIRRIQHPDDPQDTRPNGSAPSGNSGNQGCNDDSAPTKEITVPNNPMWRSKHTTSHDDLSR